MIYRERRRLDVRKSQLSIQVRSASGLGELVGRAIVYNQMSLDLGGWFEVIERGAAGDAIERGMRARNSGEDIASVVDHEPRLILGRSLAKTLDAREDDDGVMLEIPEVPDVSYARDLVVSVNRGDVAGMSFVFSIDYEDPESRAWIITDDGLLVRRVKKIARVWSLDPVTFPAYPQTEVSVRSQAARDCLRSWTGRGADELRARVAKGEIESRSLDLWKAAFEATDSKRALQASDSEIDLQLRAIELELAAADPCVVAGPR